MYADAFIRPWFDALPPLDLLDAHTHIGDADPDGLRCTADELGAALALAGARGAVFPLREPAGYRTANDRVLAAAEASQGQLIPVCRVDPHDGAVAEAERCLARGARALKLHPRTEGFTLDDAAVAALFALADERRLPIIIHGGRGVAGLGRDLLALAAAHPGARPVLAHAGICDLAWIWRHVGNHANVFFDTSWWSPVDLLALFALVPPGNVLLGSDTPYGTPLSSAVITLRCAIEAGLDGKAVRAVAGTQAQKLFEGSEPLALGPAPGVPPTTRSPLLDRVAAPLVTATAAALGGAAAPQPRALARAACAVDDDLPEAAVCRSVVSLLDRYEAYAEAARHAPDGNPDQGRRQPGMHLLALAAAVAMTPSAALPSEPAALSHRGTLDGYA